MNRALRGERALVKYVDVCDSNANILICFAFSLHVDIKWR
jgi:hypothetical protein